MDEMKEEYTTEEIDQRFALLTRYERRCLIQFLQESETDHVPVSDVVSHLRKQDPTSDEPDTIAINLHHSHLPKLATIDAFDYDSRSETIRYSGDELLSRLLESTPETHTPGT
ncbi:DUF7344 domain-containing protein [Halorubrum salsamenti]|uniref:DUF7344 domain-containing protein n=1 Tax=Halorubrum salsamenti TaxID=2583990 RepID=UPI0011A61169|nr:hypothetical protein [Halorubrum salsamenti]